MGKTPRLNCYPAETACSCGHQGWFIEDAHRAPYSVRVGNVRSSAHPSNDLVRSDIDELDPFEATFVERGRQARDGNAKSPEVLAHIITCVLPRAEDPTGDHRVKPPCGDANVGDPLPDEAVVGYEDR
ncbi:hypothetical protein ACX0MU_00200 [Rhizorhabdus wittichii]